MCERALFRLFSATRHPLSVGHGQTETGDIVKIIRPVDRHDVDKRIKGFCGAQPPQKPRWTNAGVGVALWRFHSERMVSMLKMLPQAARILALG
jgi:hypothetical protein